MALLRTLTVALASALLLISTAVAVSHQISFPSFPSNSCEPGGPLRCMQNSSVRDGYIALVREPANGTDPNLLLNNFGRVLSNSPPIDWPASFDTNFTVLIRRNANATNFGGGMAFVMTKDMSPSPEGSYGGFFGLYNHSSSGNTTGQLTVLIDTYQNERDKARFQVAVDTSSINHNASSPLNKAVVNLTKKKPVTYRVRYDGWSNNLEVLAGFAGEEPLTSVLNFSIVIARINPRYVGFTASSGPTTQYSQQIRVLSWNFTHLPESSLDVPGENGMSFVYIFAATFIQGLLGPLTEPLALRTAKRLRKWWQKGQESLMASEASAPEINAYEKSVQVFSIPVSPSEITKGDQC